MNEIKYIIKNKFELLMSPSNSYNIGHVKNMQGINKGRESVSWAVGVSR